MPAINVARTDTFEIQRQKINQIGSQIFNISQGGSDLSTGNLKLGDGTRTSPSLAFINEPGLGIYRPEANVLGYVVSGKKSLDVKSNEFVTYQDFLVQQNLLLTEGLSLLDAGQNYDPGTYSGISVTGGTGSNALLNIEVTPFGGSVTSDGFGYVPGTYSAIVMTGGSGTGTTASFTVDNLGTTITNAGTGYAPGLYQTVPVDNISSSGSSAQATIVVTDGITPSSLSGSIGNAGTGYTVPETELVSIPVINNPTQSFVVTANGATNYIVDGNPNPSLSLLKANTYRFDVSDVSNAGLTLVFLNSDDTPLNYNYVKVTKGTPGTAGAFVDLIIKPNADTANGLKYDCVEYTGMGNSISVAAGSVGVYGSGAFANVTIDVSGVISVFTFSSIGNGYKNTDIVSVDASDVGGTGSGFQFNINSAQYTGTITDVTFDVSGSGYLFGDTLTINNSYLNGFGSNLVLTVNTNPTSIVDFDFDEKGTGYVVSDVLQLPGEITGVTATLNGQILFSNVSVDTGSTTVTLSDTSNLTSGMSVVGDGTGTGAVAEGTLIQSVDSSTQITLSTNPITTGTLGLTFSSANFNYNQAVVSSISGIVINSVVTVSSGAGALPVDTTVVAVDDLTNTIVFSNNADLPGDVTLTFTPPYGSPITQFEFTIDRLGSISDYTVTDGGNGYSIGDEVSVSPFDLLTPIDFVVENVTVHKITFTQTISSGYYSVGDNVQYGTGDGAVLAEVYKVFNNGPNLEYIVIDGRNLSALTTGEDLYKEGTAQADTINTLETSYKYLIDSQLTPDLTLLAGNLYRFDISDGSNFGKEFRLSQYPGGIWNLSYIQNLSTTLSTTSPQITVSSTTNIQVGMDVIVETGSIGNLVQETKVLSVDDSNTITLSANPLLSGAATLSFRGNPYTDGVVVEANYLTIKVTQNTPTLYYYSNATDTDRSGEGGDSGDEAELTIDPNNPKVFGSGFLLGVSVLNTDDVISGKVLSGLLTAKKLVSPVGEIDDLTVSAILNAPTITTSDLTTANIISQSNLNISASAGSVVNINSDVSFSNLITIDSADGDLLVTGEIKTLDKVNINDILTIEDSTITSSSGYDIIFNPFSGRVAKVDASSALIIPSGTTAQRPDDPGNGGLAENGAIRFNTETNQYEGYNGSSNTWASLGGVRDTDGNTYILAEESVFPTPTNDNRLWFYNDGINTVRFTREYLEFTNMKKVRSLNMSAPSYTEWNTNVPVSAGDYLKYGHNIFEVTANGTTGAQGNPPLDDSGNTFVNGTAVLQYVDTAVDTLTFEELSEIRVGTNIDIPMVFRNDLRITKNTISTDLSDIIIKPNTGKRIVCQSNTHIRIPSGTDNEKSTGTAELGSIRYNTTLQTYEGYIGNQKWGSLGGVKDVDGNTYIIPESAPAANENILYFYNDNINTINVSTTQVDFVNIDTIASSGSNSLEVSASTVTFDNTSTTIDNTSLTSTRLSSTKNNLDFGLSTGLSIDTLLRLDDQGDIYYNTGFGQASENYVRIFDKDLANLEISKYRISTSNSPLLKGTTNNGSAVIYSPSSENSAKIELVAHNTTTGEKEVIEFAVIDNGSDIFYTEVGKIRSNGSLITYTFDFNVNGSVRLNYSLATGVANANAVNVTVVSNVIKK